MTHEQIKEIVKNDLREHPEKRNNIQFCVSCSAYGVDLDEVDAELSQEQPKPIEQCQTFIGTREEWDKLPDNEKQKYSVVEIRPNIQHPNIPSLSISAVKQNNHWCSIDNDVDDPNHCIGGFHDW